MAGLSESRWRYVALLGATVTLQGCLLDSLFDGPEIDLARNPYIYQRSEYEAPRRTNAPVYVTRLKDRRELPDLDKGPNYRQIFSDEIWARSIPVMVEEILIEEIDHSKIYNGISSGNGGTPKSTDIILEPTLLYMYRMREVMTEAGMTGRRRTVAVSSLQIRIRGPVDVSGGRPTLMDEVFYQHVATQPRLGRPEEGIALTGRTLEQIMKRALAKIYESNSVVRSEPAAVPASTGKTGEPNADPAKRNK
jgi:hypothetical protein